MPTSTQPAYILLDDEAASEFVLEMQGREEIRTEGVVITFGTHPNKGRITVVMPSAGKTILLYPFE